MFFKKIAEGFVTAQKIYKALKIEKDRINDKYGLLIQVYNDTKKELAEIEKEKELLEAENTLLKKKTKTLLNKIAKLTKAKDVRKICNEFKKTYLS